MLTLDNRGHDKNGGALVLRFLSETIQYLPILILSLLLISPLIHTGLPLKKYTRLNEILLIITIVTLCWDFMKNKRVFLVKRTEILIILTGVSSVVSVFYGHLFLGVSIGWIDFYQTFNIILFLLYFRTGTYFRHERFKVGAKIIILVSILVVNLLSLSQLLPWGFINVLPLYMPDGMIKSSGYEMVFLHEGSIGRIVGTISSATSFAMMMVIVILLLAGWGIFIPIKNRIVKLLHGLLITLSVTTLILTFSRTGQLTFFVAAAYLGGVAVLVEKKKTNGVLVAIIMGYVLYFVMQNIPDLYLVNKASMRGFRIAHTFT
ncbi:hypothetical protein EG832_06720, partial [bacterium]|nr:hypothetical protein [bacterium]